MVVRLFKAAPIPYPKKSIKTTSPSIIGILTVLTKYSLVIKETLACLLACLFHPLTLFDKLRTIMNNYSVCFG